MGKKTYIGIDSKARRVKKVYIGIDGKARKVKKIYIGDANGKARCVFSGGFGYAGTATALSDARYKMGGATIGNYAVFAGGSTASITSVTTVDVYDASLTRTTPVTLSHSRSETQCNSAVVGNYLVYGSTDGNYNGYAEYFTTSLSRGVITASVYAQRGAGSVGNYALFAGGSTKSGGITSIVNSCNASLTWGSTNGLGTIARSMSQGVSIGDYVIFAGGYAKNSGAVASVDAFNSSLTRKTPTELTSASYTLSGTAVGNYALFANDSTVCVYDTSLTKRPDLTIYSALYRGGATTIGDYAIFAGGYANSAGVSTVYTINNSLTVEQTTSLNKARLYIAGASIGSYALFAGGISKLSSGTVYTTVDVFEI